MSFYVPNWGSIAGVTPGQPNPSISVGYNWGGQSQGAQFAEGFPQSSGANLVSTDQEIDNDGGGTYYWFVLTNTGSAPNKLYIKRGRTLLAMAKVRVITDREGRIVGSVRLDPIKTDKGTIQFQARPSSQQKSHDLDIPDAHDGRRSPKYARGA